MTENDYLYALCFTLYPLSWFMRFNLYDVPWGLALGGFLTGGDSNAAAGPRAAFAQQTILMNVPPRGGAFDVVPSIGYELNGTFALRASYWLDDADDLPLSYAFGFSRGGT